MSRSLVAKFGFDADNAAELELRLTEYLPHCLVRSRIARTPEQPDGPSLGV